MIRKVYKTTQILFNKPLLMKKTAPIIKEISIIWHIEDVQSIRPDLTDEQASFVLRHLEKNHDATVGINWDTIEVIADCLFPLNKTTSFEHLSQEGVA